MESPGTWFKRRPQACTVFLVSLKTVCVGYLSTPVSQLNIYFTSKNVEKITKWSVKDFRETLNDVWFGYFSNSDRWSCLE